MATAELTVQKQPFAIEPITYPVLIERINDMAAEYGALTIAGIDDKAGEKKVHAARMVVKNARVEIEKRRKVLKASSLEYGRKVDAAAKELTELLEPIEERLLLEEARVQQQRDEIRRKADEAKRAATQARYDALAAVNCILPWVEVERLSDEAYTLKLTEATEAHRVAAEKAAAEEAERERTRAAEEARLQAERERLDAERAELERRKAEQAAQEAAFQERQRRIDELIRFGKTAAEAVTSPQVLLSYVEWQAYIGLIEAEYNDRKQQEEVEARRIAEEQAARERAEAEAKRQAELEEAQRQAAERARIETEERLAREAEERRIAEEAAEAERARQEALKPDREKLIALAGTIETVKLPEISPAARDAAVVAYRAIMDCGAKIRAAAEGL